ncbi:MAG: MoxR-like ATPase [Lentimonas sp.]|jgi:MoxR-like ATPase
MSVATVDPALKALERVERLRKNVERTIRGKTDVVDQVIICLLAGGHILIEDLPGLGKTTLAHCLARSIHCSFSRIQFTSDMLPSDILGVSIYDERERAFSFRRGPVFANIVLADEINRTTPKTQSSLLEVMGRARISMDGETHILPPPFMVIATQNPVDYEGTFPLPDSQMDRFLMRISMGYPAYESELEILKSGHLHSDNDEVDAVLSQAEVVELQAFTREVFVEDSIYAYMVQLAVATRDGTAFRSGVSPRGTLSLKAAAQARALTQGRAFVVPEDVRSVVPSVFGHRLALSQSMADPLEERRVVAECIQQIIERISEPN